MRALVVLLALSCGLAGCGDDTSPTAPSAFPQSVTLQPAEQANVGGLIVIFEQVVADSRCPSNVTCVQAGDVTLSISLSTGGIGSRYAITATAPATKRVVYRDYQIELITVQPARTTQTPIDPASYRATFTITKN